MKIIKEFGCPHCGKIIQFIELRKPTTVRRDSKHSTTISIREGKYEYRKG